MAGNLKSLHVEVAVIGAGSAGLSAFRRLESVAADAVLIDPGPLGTMCARTGCMPSKALISVAKDFHRRRVFDQEGISGADRIACDLPAVMAQVRQLRDHFVSGMKDTTEQLAGERLIRGRARLVGRNTIETELYLIEAEKIIVATGAKPIIPDVWQSFSDRILTSETLFEQTDLPQRLAVIGMSVEGLELGQALGRLGLDVVCFGRNQNIGGVTDPVVNRTLLRAIGNEITIHTNAEAEIHPANDGDLMVEADGVMAKVDGLLLAMGVKPNLADLGLERLEVELDEKGMPPWNPETGQIADLPIYLAGDASGHRPVLHEAIDEGFIAAYNATVNERVCAKRRVPMRICFSDPQAVVVGKSWKELETQGIAVGEVDFADVSRAVLEQRDTGRLRVYADPASGRLLGAEMAAAEAEHLGHLLALAMQQQLTVNHLLKMPFYHPTITEAMRTALQDAMHRFAFSAGPAGLDLNECGPEKPL